MKTVTVTLQDSEWLALEHLADSHEAQVADLASQILAKEVIQDRELPSPEARRAELDTLWRRFDARNVEVGERPTRARTYDDRRLHRH